MNKSAPKWGLRRSTSLLVIFPLVSLVMVGVPALAVTVAGGDDTEPCVPTETTTVTAWFTEDPGAPWTATGEERVKAEGTDPTYTEWEDNGGPVQTQTNTPPGADTDTVRWLPAGTVKVIDQDYVPGTPAQDTRVWWILKGKDWAPNEGTPPADHPSWKAQPNLPSDNSQHSYPGENGLGNPYQPGRNEGNGDWFRFTGTLTPAVPETPEQSHTEYLWQEQVRTLVPGTDAVMEYEFTRTIAGNDCPSEPPVDDGDDESPGPKGDQGSTGNQGVQVAGEQAAVSPTAQAQVPTSVASGLGGTAASARSDLAPVGMLMIMLGALLTAAALRRRERV